MFFLPGETCRHLFKASWERKHRNLWFLGWFDAVLAILRRIGADFGPDAT